MLQRRPGWTLVEVLVATAVAAAVATLAVGAVAQVRAAAVRMSSMNKLRQIALATRQYAEAHSGELPYTYGYLDALGFAPDDDVDKNGFFLSPADPTRSTPPSEGCRDGRASYAVNALVFSSASWGRGGRLEQVADGVSATISHGERYAQCGKTGVSWWLPVAGMDCLGSYTIGNYTQFYRVPCVNPDARPPSFAEQPWVDDVRPVPGPGGTLPSTLGVTFQVRPAPADCDYRQLQTPHPGGMLTAYLDGSVRTTAPAVAPAVFWSAVTPAGGEVATD